MIDRPFPRKRSARAAITRRAQWEENSPSTSGPASAKIMKSVSSSCRTRRPAYFCITRFHCSLLPITTATTTDMAVMISAIPRTLPLHLDRRSLRFPGIFCNNRWMSRRWNEPSANPTIFGIGTRSASATSFTISGIDHASDLCVIMDGDRHEDTRAFLQ